MSKPAVIIVGADKGGVGKATVAHTLLDYFDAHPIPTRAFDTECPNGTLKRFHPDVTDIVDINLVPDQMKIFDTLNSADAPVSYFKRVKDAVEITIPKAQRDGGRAGRARLGAVRDLRG